MSGCPSEPSFSTFEGMAVLPVGAAQVEVSCSIAPCNYHLFWYGSNEFVVPGWWIGVEDSHGELQRTSFLPSAGVGPYDLLTWLVPITGRKVAVELVDRTKAAVASTHSA